MSFTAFPPEVNSGLMYMGGGSASLMQAASAWNGLSADLSGAAGGVSNVIGGLQSSWQGASAAKMTAAAAPYTSWLGETSALAGQMGAQASAQAGLYETAHAAVIPPAAIEANRVQLMTLIATNFFGQNSPAIAATEAQYAAYWATDGAVMDSYMASTQANLASLQQPASPAPATTDAGQAQPLAAQTLGNSGPGTGGETPPVTNPGTATGGTVGDMLNMFGVPTEALPASFTGASAATLSSTLNMAAVPARFAMYPMSMLMQLARMGQSMGSAAGTSLAGNSTSLMESIGQFVDGKLQGAVGTLAGHFSSATQAISAKLANASSLGALRVPEGWSSAAAGVTRAAPILPSAPVSAPSLSSSGFPGGAFGQALMGAMSGRGMGSVASKVPKMIPRPSSGG